MFDFLAYIGGFFYLVCYAPQIYDLWFEHTDRINTLFFIIQLFGAGFMTAYAYLNTLYPIIALNTSSIVCIFIILYGIKKNKN